jgi:hypothetical protein
MICAYENCEGIREFEPKTHNQKYCSDECCRIATNKNLKEQYYRNKARKAGVKFKCKNKGCKRMLDRYTVGDTCNWCQGQEKLKERKNLIDMIEDVSS